MTTRQNLFEPGSPTDSFVDTTTTAGYEYWCETNVPGAAKSDAKWRIQRKTLADSLLRWADNEPNVFDKVASTPAIYTYS